MAKYRLKAPISAILHKPGGQKESVTLLVGAVLDEASRHSATIEGKVGVYSDGKHYSVSLKDLLNNGEMTRSVTVSPR
jgi:hypothetical protein